MASRSSETNVIIGCVVLAVAALLYSFLRVPQTTPSTQIDCPDKQQISRLSSQNFELKKQIAIIKAGNSRQINNQGYEAERSEWALKQNKYQVEIQDLNRKVTILQSTRNDCGTDTERLSQMRQTEQDLKKCVANLKQLMENVNQEEEVVRY